MRTNILSSGRRAKTLDNCVISARISTESAEILRDYCNTTGSSIREAVDECILASREQLKWASAVRLRESATEYLRGMGLSDDKIENALSTAIETSMEVF